MSLKTKVLIFVGIITAVMVVQFFVSGIGQGHTMRMEPTGHGVPYAFDAGPFFHSNNSRFYFVVTRDGIQYRPSNGEARWSHSFNFTQPLAVARGDFVAVGERQGGRRVEVFSAADERLFVAEFNDPVMMFSVSATGLLSVVVQYAAGGYGIYVENQQSVRGIRGLDSIYSQRIVDDLHFPVAVEISHDGRYIAVATLDVSGIRPETTIEFRYIHESHAWAVGVDDQEGLFASEIFNGQLIYGMRFMENNRFVVATTSQIVGFQMTPRAYAPTAMQILWTRELQNELAHLAFYGNRHIVYVTGNMHLGVASGDPVGTVHMINSEGEPVGEFSLGRRATHLSVGHGAVLVGSDRNFHAIDMRGNHLWEHNALHYTLAMIFLDDRDTVLIAGANRAEVNARQRTRVNEFETGLD
ncbi:MAG: DUF5711 family protein [Defluviitaleaceae bacterium]|nr:DUF5711 family protein [Defluviitaleaceae bacterium]